MRRLLILLLALLRLLILLLALLAATAPDMTINDVANYLGVTPRTVRHMVADGRLIAYKLGARVVRFRRSDIDKALVPHGGAA
jgi:excisionase family DNA binding protein